jgi:hypothetical protein
MAGSCLLLLLLLLIVVVMCIKASMDLQEVGGGGVDWIELAQDRERWWAFVNMVMDLGVP